MLRGKSSELFRHNIHCVACVSSISAVEGKTPPFLCLLQHIFDLQGLYFPVVYTSSGPAPPPGPTPPSPPLGEPPQLCTVRGGAGASSSARKNANPQRLLRAAGASYPVASASRCSAAAERPSSCGGSPSVRLLLTISLSSLSFFVLSFSDRRSHRLLLPSGSHRWRNSKAASAVSSLRSFPASLVLRQVAGALFSRQPSAEKSAAGGCSLLPPPPSLSCLCDSIHSPLRLPRRPSCPSSYRRRCRRWPLTIVIACSLQNNHRHSAAARCSFLLFTFLGQS